MIQRFFSRQFAMLLGNQPHWSLALQPLLHWLRPASPPGFYRARFESACADGVGSYSVWLRPERRWPGFVPGQHLQLMAELNGRLLKRTFSISSSLAQWQLNGRIRLTIKVNPQGQLSQQLELALQQQTLTWLSISAAEGAFVWHKPARSTLMLAAGSGITPLASMLFSQRCWTQLTQLVYLVRRREDAALLDELTQLAAQQPLFRFELIETAIAGRPTFAGWEADDFAPAQLLSCGPFDFTEAAMQLGSRLGLSGLNCQREFFRLPAPAVDDQRLSWPVRWLNGNAEMTAAVQASQSLLQGAEQAGLSPRYGCRQGVCYECVCDKVSGVVRDLRTGQLSGNGPEQIQLCVSVPQSAVAVRLGAE